MVEENNVLPFVRPQAAPASDPDITPGSMRVDTHYILDAAGRPVKCVDLFTWARWFEANQGRKRVAFTQLGPNEFISTVFLGLDHNFSGPFGGDPRPILYETMIHEAGGWGDQWRYRTREQALAHHLLLRKKYLGKRRYLKRYARQAKTRPAPVKLTLVA